MGMKSTCLTDSGSASAFGKRTAWLRLHLKTMPLSIVIHLGYVKRRGLLGARNGARPHVDVDQENGY